MSTRKSLSWVGIFPKTRRATARSGAVLLALGILLASGTGYRLLETAYGARAPAPPEVEDRLSRLPLELDSWLGREEPLAANIIEASDTDAHLSRRYVKSRAGSSVHLWVAYGTQVRDLAPHRPEVCYPAAGWVFEESRSVEVTCADRPRMARLTRFRRGGFESRAVAVLHWYVVNGEQTADLGMLRSSAWKLRARPQSVLQVQLSTLVREDLAASPESDLVSLAAAVAPDMERLLAGNGLDEER